MTSSDLLRSLTTYYDVMRPAKISEDHLMNSFNRLRPLATAYDLFRIPKTICDLLPPTTSYDILRQLITMSRDLLRPLTASYKLFQPPETDLQPATTSCDPLQRSNILRHSTTSYDFLHGRTSCDFIRPLTYSYNPLPPTTTPCDILRLSTTS